MNAWMRACSAEWMKLRHTLAAWLVLIAPLVIVFLAVMQFSVAKFHGPGDTPPEQIWQGYCNGMFTLWTFLMLPLYVCLQASLLAQLEHGNHQWKHLLALPVPRWSHYLAKCTVLLVMVLVSTLVLFVLTPLGGFVVMKLAPTYGLAGPAPWGWLFVRAMASLAAAGMMMALQIWVALRWRSFTVSIGVGIACTVTAFLTGQSARFGPWFPWSMPSQVFAGEGAHMQQVAVAGIIGCAVLLIAGAWDFSRREYA